MANKITLKDYQGVECYPKTHEKQVLTGNGSQTLDEKLTELSDNVGLYNVDKNVPLGSGFYTSTTARAAVPTSVRKLGLIITYKTDATTSVTEQFIGSAISAWATDTNWKNVGSEGGNKILEWKTDAATTRKKVPVKERKAGMQISYKPTDSDWVNEQYVGTSFTDTEWVKDSNWEKIPKQKQLTELEKKMLLYKKGYINRNNGEITDFTTSFCREGYVPLIDGETKINYIGKAQGSSVSAIAFYDEEKNFISALPSGNQTVYEIKDADIPINAKYIRYSNGFGISLSIYTNVRQIEYMPIDEIFNIKTEVESVKTEVESVKTEVESVKTEVEELREDVTVIEDEIIASNLVEGSTESPSHGTLFFGNNTPLEYNITQIIYKANNVYQNNKLIIFDYNENDNKFTAKEIHDIADAIVGDNTIDISITIKKGQALYILGNDVFKSGETNIIGANTLMIRLNIRSSIKVGDILPSQGTFKGYKSIKLIGKYRNVLNVYEVNKLIQGGEFDKITNYLKGKVLCVTGDSEAAGSNLKKEQTYGNLIAERNGMTVYNTAVNGRKLAYVEDNLGSGTPLVKAIDEIREDADYILCHIGYNDSFDELEEDDSHDITKYKGAFNTVIEEWQNIRPKAKIGIILPYYFNNMETKIKRAEWMKKRCEYYHVQCIDGTIVSGLRHDCEGQQIYFGDAVHLTALGHERMSYLYEYFMRGL